MESLGYAYKAVLQDAANLVIDISPALEGTSHAAGGQQVLPLSGPALLQELQRRALTPSALGSDGGAPAMAAANLQDVVAILDTGRAAVVCALTDLKQLAADGLKHCKGEKKGKDGRHARLLVDRKLLFLLVWANEQAGDVWEGLAAEVRAVAPAAPKQLVQSGVLIEPGQLRSVAPHSEDFQPVKAGSSMITEL